MTTKILLAAVVSSLMCPSYAGAAQQYQPFPTIWTGVYTKAQADRGKQTAARLCGTCHGPELKGTAKAPPLTGYQFFVRWENLRLFDVIAYIQGAMPREHDFFVSRESSVDITAFMLRESGVPAGDKEMSSDANALQQILIGPRK